MRCGVSLAGAFLLTIIGPTQAAVRWDDISRQPAGWYAGDEARTIAASILQYKTAEGGWPKNTDMTAPPSSAFLSETDWERRAATIDNGAATTQLEFLVRVLTARPDDRFSRNDAAPGRKTRLASDGKKQVGVWEGLYARHLVATCRG